MRASGAGRIKYNPKDMELSKIFEHKAVTYINHVLMALSQIENRNDQESSIYIAEAVNINLNISPIEDFPCNHFRTPIY